MKLITSSILFTTLLFCSSTLALPTTASPRATSPTAYYCSGYTKAAPLAVASTNSTSPSAVPTSSLPSPHIVKGTNVANKLQPCNDPAVSSNQVPGVGEGVVVVQHTFTKELGDGGVATYWVSGNTTVPDDHSLFPYSFVIEESEVRAVA